MAQISQQYKHVIWDWNGTLIDDKWLCIESINSLLKDREISPIDEDKYHRIFGFPVKEYYARAGFDFTREPFEAPAMQFIDLYDRKKHLCLLQPDAMNVIRKLHANGCRQYLLSASETGVLTWMAEFHGIRDYFSKIAGLDNHYANSKVELGLELLSQINPEPGSVVMVGDTCHDEEVAFKMGIPCILFTGGHYPADRLKSCSSRLIGRLRELVD
jgi:phosphoglycolate phosphatase